MKKGLLIILIFSISNSILGQANFYDFQVSANYSLTNLDSVILKRIDLGDRLENTKVSIFLIDHSGNNLKEFKVNPLQYKPEKGVTYVSEISRFEPKLALKNINNIVKVQIVQCNMVCKYSIYYWLINNQNQWIELPKIEYDFKIDTEYEDYYFPYDVTNQIGVAKYKIVESKNGDTDYITEEFLNYLNCFNWDGVILSEK